MKNFKNLTLLILVFYSSVIFAQVKDQSKFNIIFNGGFGFGQIENDSEPNYIVNNNSIDLLFTYDAFKYFGLSTGIGYIDLSGNGFNSIGSFYHKQSVITIPLLYTLKSRFTNNSIMLFSAGICALNVINDEYTYLNSTQKDIYEGWGYGYQVGLSLYTNISQFLNIGFTFNTLSDFSEITSKNQQVVNKQKISNINVIGISILFNL